MSRGPCKKEGTIYFGIIFVLVLCKAVGMSLPSFILVFT